MKFDCGLTRKEKWKLSFDWHEWFAWYPVRVGRRDCRWLEKVERKRLHRGDEWYYRAKGES